VNQAADAGDDEDHDGRERVDHEGHVDFQGAEIDPAIEIVDEKALFRFETYEDEERPNRKTEGDHHRSARNQPDGAFAHALLDLRAQ
jgi:hypothetical protein